MVTRHGIGMTSYCEKYDSGMKGTEFSWPCGMVQWVQDGAGICVNEEWVSFPESAKLYSENGCPLCKVTEVQPLYDDELFLYYWEEFIEGSGGCVNYIEKVHQRLLSIME